MTKRTRVKRGVRQRISMHRYVYAIVLFLVGVTATYLLWSGVIGGREVGTAFLALIGTFVGALFAFRLNENKETRKLEVERKAALNSRPFRALKAIQRYLLFREADRTLQVGFRTGFQLPRTATAPLQRSETKFLGIEFPAGIS